MGGQEGNRGYLVQAIIALLESLNDLEWTSVTVEPDHASQQVDVLWEHKTGRKATQVKSSGNQISKADAVNNDSMGIRIFNSFYFLSLTSSYKPKQGKQKTTLHSLCCMGLVLQYVYLAPKPVLDYKQAAPCTL